MNKRSYVPTSLRSELTEYSSLLRALRTSNALDVSLHLRQHGKFNSDSSSDESDQLRLPNDLSSPAPSITPKSSSIVPASSEPPSNTAKGTKRKRDSWTRWPLLASDLHVPTWDLEDEIATIASQAAKLFPHPLSQTLLHETPTETSPRTDPEKYAADIGNIDMDADDPECSSYYKFLTLSTSTFLANLLALLAAHTPARPPSMQNRIEPLDWRSVLEIASIYGDTDVIDTKIINKVKARMETLYGLTLTSTYIESAERENMVTYRLGRSVEARSHLNNTMLQAREGLFTLSERPPPGKKTWTKNRRTRESAKSNVKRGVKSSAFVITSEGSEGDVSLEGKQHDGIHATSSVVQTVTRSLKPRPRKKTGSNDVNTAPSETIISSVPEDPRIINPSQEASKQMPSPRNLATEGHQHGRTRTAFPRRARAHASYTAPDYFFDDDTMGGRR
ncbi:hypothetical protein AX17_001620 [Amanita inopinata Kibby_2008]|nr:hypothetical protein AX17_001620 [Amanita inopinata Kibby_2008]